MWSISDVKREGWEKVKKYYWPALGVSIIAGIFSGGGGGAAGSYSSSSDEIGYRFSGIPAETRYMLTSIFLIVIIAVFLVGFILKVFVGNPLIVGKNRYFMESRALEGSAGVGKTFWVFSCGHYLNVVKIMFLRDLFNSLWYLLLIIPGIIKAYEYTMIPYILSENPEADTKDVFALTKDMMNGSKFQYFCLELSFLGWYLLGMLACCIGMILVNPYVEAASAEVYAAMRKQIGGFPFNGYGIPEPEDMYENVYGNGYGNESYGDETYGNRYNGNDYNRNDRNGNDYYN